MARAGSFLVLALLISAFSATLSTQEPWTSVIDGRVVEPVGGTGIGGVRVQIGRVADESIRIPFVQRSRIALQTSVPAGEPLQTDSTGAFRFSGLAPGLYEVIASGSGGSGRPGATSSLDPGRLIRVAASRTATVRVPLWRDASLTGRVLDPAGSPVIGIPVVALPEDAPLAKEQRLEATTDDRGQFTIIVPPGRYTVAAYPPPYTAPRAVLAALPDGRTGAYVRTFHPRVTGRADARRLDAGPAAEVSGLDIQLTPVEVYSVTTGFPVPPGIKGVPLIWISHVDEPGPFGAVASGGGHVARHELRGIPPGRYLLQAYIAPPMPSASHGVWPLRTLPADPTYWADAHLDITRADVSAPLTLRHGYRLSGRVVFEGASPPALVELQAWPIVVEGTADHTRDLRASFVSAAAFSSIQLPPGRYFVRPFPLGDWHFKSLGVGGRNTTDAPIDLGEADRADLTITFSDRPAVVEGQVELDSGPEPQRPSVYVFPAERELWPHMGPEPSRIAVLLTGADGRFQAAVPPGVYYVAAAIGPVRLPSDLERLAGSADTVRIIEGSSVSSRLLKPVTLR